MPESHFVEINKMTEILKKMIVKLLIEKKMTEKKIKINDFSDIVENVQRGAFSQAKKWLINEISFDWYFSDKCDNDKKKKTI